MKTLLFCLVLLFPSLVLATPSRLVVERTGQRIEFPKCTTDGNLVWDQATCNASSRTVVAIVPLAFEVNLSTILIVNSPRGEPLLFFKNHSDWLACQTKIGLQDKVQQIRTLINSMSDLPAATRTEIEQRAGWLRSYYQSLP